MKHKQFLFALAVMLSGFGITINAQVAMNGSEYTTLKDAMTEANKAAGDYTITLLQNSAEVFTFAQKSGVNITVDGDQNTFSGKITLSAGYGKLTFTDAVIAPANSQTIYLNASTAPNVTFDGCTLQGTNKSGTIIYGYASATSNAALTVKNCTADNLQYIVSHRQTGAKSVLVENVTATNMIYLVRTLKCSSVTVKNVTFDGVIGIDIKNDAAGGKLTLEDVNINTVTYNGSLYAPVMGSGAGKSWTVEHKGNNTFSKNGVACEGNSWFSGNAGYKIVDANVAKIGDKLYYDFATAFDAAQPGQTIVLLADYTGDAITLTEGVKLDANGFNAEGITVNLPTYTVQIGEQGYKTLAAAISAATAGQTITFVADITEDVTVSKAVTIDGAGNTYTGKMTLKADATIKNLNFDGKGYNGYAVETRGANKLTIEDCTAKNYGYGFVQLASGTDLVTVKDVTVSDMGYGVKVDYSNAVVLENVDITAGVAAVLNSNYGEKTITVKNSKLNILGTWGRNTTIKTTYAFEGANTVGKFVTDDAIDNFKLAAGATLTAPNEITVTTVEDYAVEYENGTYMSVAGKFAVNGKKYKTLDLALDAAKPGDTLDMFDNATIATTINGAGLTINGNGHTLTYTGSGASARAITVESAANGANLTIKNLTIDCTASYCPRGINYNTTGELVLDGVTVKGKNVTYALNLPGSSVGAKVTINESSLTGNIALNVWGKNAEINATGSHFTSVDNNTAEGYSAIVLNNDGTTAAEGAIVNIDGGTITAKDENGNLSNAVRNATANGVINVSDETTVVGTYSKPVAIVTYGTDQFYSCATLQAAIDKAIETKGAVKLIADVTASEIIVVNAPVVIDGNGKTLTSTATGPNARAINVSGADGVTIKNLTIDAKGERAINVINGATNVTIDNVTATAANYTVNLAGSAANAVVTIKNSNLTGLNVVNVAAAGAKVTVTGGTLTCNDKTDIESYAALAIATNASKATITATGVTFNIEGDSSKAGNGTTDGTITIDGVVVGQSVAMIQYANGTAYTFKNLADAVAKAEAGETVVLLADVTVAEIITINKAITLDGNGKKLTSTAARAINIETDGKVVINNLTVNAGERAFNIINKAATVELNGVTATANNNAVMVATSAGAAKVTIDDCNFTGLAVVNVAGAGAQVAINDTKITNVDANEAENYGAITVYSTATDAKVTVTGGSITVAGDSKKAYIFAEGATVTGVDEIGQIVAMIGDAGYETLTEAIADAKEGQTVKMVNDVTLSEILVINKAITLDGNGKKLTSTAGRAINVDCEGNVAIKNLTINASGERAINVITKPANVTIENVTATAANYTVNVASSAGAAKVAISKSTLNGLCTVNVAAAGAQVTIDNSTVNCNDNNTTAGESYAALCLNKAAVGASIVAANSEINVAAGSDSEKGRNGAENGNVTINGSTEGVTVTVAVITYPGSDNYHGFTSLADAIEFAKAGDVVTLIRDVTGAGVVIDKNVTIDFNGKTYTVNKTVGSAGTTTLGLQILKDNNVTLKNGTLKSTAVTEGNQVKMLVQNYANLTVENMNLVDETEHILYVLSNNSGNVVVKGETNITTDAIAFDACKYANYALPTVTVAEGVVVKGNVEVSATLNMNGTLNGAIVINGADGVVNGAEGLNVSTTVGADYKVVYADGKYAVGAKNYVAQVGEAKYETLAEAVAVGGEVTLLADVNESVTLAKNVTIDGASKNYTGTMTINNVTATIQNVAFVKGQVYKHKNTGSAGVITIKDCTFDGQGLNAYAVNVGNGQSLNIENVTAKSYGYGFLQVPSSFSSISVKDVEVSSMYYGFKVDYAGAVSMENVTIADDVTTGIYDSNYGDKTYTIKNSEISSISIWERSAAKTTTFKFEGLNKVASFTTSQYAKVVAEAKSSNNYYGDLAAVVAATQDDVTVELLANVTLKGGNEKDAEAGLVIDKAITFEGNGHTIDCGTFVKGIRIYGHSNLTDIKINNVTVVNNNVYGRCVDTRAGLLRLKFSKANLIATNTNSQPLTVGGSDKIHQIDLSNCTIDAGNSGYGIISFVPTSQAIKIMSSKVTGYAAVYLKGDGTKVTITTNSDVIGKNVHSGDSNAFGAVVFEGNNNTVNINATSPMLKAVAEGNMSQAAFLVKSGEGNSVVIETNKGAEVVAEGENAYFTMVNPEATGTSIVKDGATVELGAECDGFQFLTFADAMRYAKNGSTVKLLADVNYTTANCVTDCDGYSTIVNVEGKALTIDLNGKKFAVEASAEDLTNAKSKMLMAVFSVDEGGKLTINDSSEDKTGTVCVTANDAMVYSVVANYTEGAKLTINGGNFIADKVYDSMIYSGAHEAVTVNDGYFNLGNLGTPEVQNGKPWIFNVLGANERHLFVNGGTFNADINHQYWAFEVVVPETRALRKNADDTWTMVDAAAWVYEPWKKYKRAVGYATLEEAIAVDNKFENTVTLAKNVEVENMITVANGETLVLNLNGKTLAATDNTTKNYSLIDNRGNLTIVDSSEDGTGKMTVKAAVNSGWNRYSAVIANNPGGKLTVENGTIEHLGGTDMAYGIDNLTNGKDTYAETIINGGLVKSPYRAVRQFLNGVEAQNILTVNGGTLEGANKSIFFHDPSTKANNGKLYVAEDATLKGDVYLFVTAGSTEWPVEVEIAKKALVGESKVLSANVPENAAALVEYDEFWQVEQKKIAELTIVDENYAEYINKVEKTVGKLTYVRTFETTEWQSIYLPFEVPVEALTAAGLQAAYIYNASYKDGAATIDHVVMTEGSLAANYPYMICALEAGTKVVVVENATLTVTDGDYDAVDCSSVYEKFTFTGTYKAVVAEDLVSSNKVKNFVLEDGVYSELEETGAFRFYLTIAKRQGVFPTAESLAIRTRSVDQDGNTTGIDGIDAENAGDFIFDLHGRRVLEPLKGGLYIINGKKVIF